MKLFLKSPIKACLLTLFICLPWLITGQYHLVFKDRTEQDVLAEVSKKLDVRFNYNHTILTNRLHRFSVSGDRVSVLAVVSEKLQLKIIPLDDEIYAINKLEEDFENEEIPFLSFKIVDESDLPLAFTSIILPELDLIYQSDINGNCKIEGYVSDKDKVILSYLGYHNIHTNIKTLRRLKTMVMKSADHVLGEIVLTDFLSVRSNDLENRTSLQDIPLAGLSDQDLLKKAQLLPGIHSTSESLNDLQIRGGPPDQVSYKWNDIRMLQTSLFYGQVSGINPFMVDEIGITRNGTSADQSGQASGSILLESKDEINNTAKIKFFSDLLYGNIGLNLPVVRNRLSAKIAYRKSHNYLFDSRIYQNYFDQMFQFGQLTNDQFYIDFFDIRGQEEIERKFNFDDLSANIAWKPTRKSLVTASVVSLSNRFEYNYFDGFFTDETKSDQLEISNLGWNITAKNQWSSKWKAKFLYSGSNYENRYIFERDKASKSDEDRSKVNTVGQYQIAGNVSYDHRFFNLELGLQNEQWNVDYIDTTRNPSSGLFYDKSSRSTQEQSAFAKIKWIFIPKTLIETGIRYSDFGFSLVDRKFVEPRLHISHNILPQLTIHAHYGLYHQNLNRRQFFSSLDVEKGVWYLSDERPESDNFIWVVQNRQSSIGLKYLWERWKFSLDAYVKKAQNIWTSALDFAVEEDPFKFADLDVKGLEIATHFHNKNWKLIWTYELTDETLTIKAGDDYRIKSPYTQPHKWSMMQSYKRGRWSFSSRWRYNSGRRFSKGASFVTITEPELYYTLEYENILEERIPAYHSLDVSGNYKWTFNSKKNRSVELGIHVQNLYNRQNVIKRQYYIDYTKTPFEMAYYDRKGLGFTPNISVLLNF